MTIEAWIFIAIVAVLIGLLAANEIWKGKGQ